MAEPPDALARALSDRYRLERELGAGGMATVWLAQDLKHQRQVAVKVLREDLTASLGKERFLREITIAAGLTHPHILPLHDSGEAAGRLFYVMPYVDGPSLRQKLLRGGELPVADAVRILRDVADAMAHAHKRGVAHRDLKPENVMLTERHALVTDFGVAKAVSEATGRHTLTTAGVALGTPAYMSPEQATADPNADHRSDIYAFGVLAYELLTGRPPFSGGSPQEVLAAHVTTAAIPVAQHRASIPPVLAALVMRCLEKKPADRPQRAEELIPQLEALLTPSGGVTPPETAPYPQRISSARWGQRVPLLGALAVAAVLLGTWRLWRPSYPEPVKAARVDTRPSILVMPASGSTSGDADFAEGFQQELRATIAKLGGLRVVVGWSPESLSATRQVPQAIGQWTGAEYALETAFSSSDAEIRVSVTLQRVADQDVVWSETYPTTRAADLFALQARIARAVSGELRAALSAAEERRLAEGGTADPQAYELYLRAFAAGNDYEEPARAVMETAQRLLEAATARDSGFALAFARLAGVHGWFVLRRWDQSDERKHLARITAERAMRLAPDLPESHLAMATYYYRVTAEYQKALDALSQAEGSLRGDGYAALLRAYIQRRMGRFDAALASLMEARDASPRSDVPYLQLVQTLRAMRRYGDAVAFADSAVRLRPERVGNHSRRALVAFESTGSTQALRAYLATVQNPDVNLRLRWLVEFVEGHFGAALAALDRAGRVVVVDQTTVEPTALFQGWTHAAAGDTARAHAAFLEALRVVDSMERSVGDDHRMHRARALALAGLGRRQEAVDEARRAIDLWPPSKDALDGPLNYEALGVVHAAFGDVSEAVDALRTYLSGASYGMSRAQVRIDPRFASLRTSSAFQQLVAEPSAKPPESR